MSPAKTFRLEVKEEDSPRRHGDTEALSTCRAVSPSRARLFKTCSIDRRSTHAHVRPPPPPCHPFTFPPCHALSAPSHHRPRRPHVLRVPARVVRVLHADQVEQLSRDEVDDLADG